MPLTRYDLEDPGSPGVFDERYWDIVNIPVMADGDVSQIHLQGYGCDTGHPLRSAQMINCRGPGPAG